MDRLKSNGFAINGGSSLTLRTKLLLLILGVACSLVITLIVLGLDAIHQTSETAQTISRSALENLSRDHMMKVTEENAGRNSLILEKTMTEAGLLADAAGQYFSEPGRYSMIGYLQGTVDLQKMPEGQHLEGSLEQASIFIPNDVGINDVIAQQIQVSRALDPLALSILNIDKKATAVYFISPDGLTRY